MSTVQKLVIAYEIVDHGEDGSSYFPGCGVAFTSFDDVATGIGDSARDAANDALEQLFQGEWDAWNHAVLADLEAEIASLPDTPIDRGEGDDFNDEWHYFVSIRVKHIT